MNITMTRRLLAALLTVSAVSFVGSAATAQVTPPPGFGQTESFDPAIYAKYEVATAATRHQKDTLTDLAAKSRATGDWTAFDAAATARNRSLGAASAAVSHRDITPAAVSGNFHWVSGTTQYPQETSWYCGPAAGEALLQGWAMNGWYFNHGWATQDGLAGTMGTTQAYGTGIYNWASGMNAWIWGNPNQPGGWIYRAASTEQTMVNDVRGNIDGNWGAGVNTVEITGGLRYNGHLAGARIRHFVAAYGYESVANFIRVSDSAANSAAIGWPAAQTTWDFTHASMFNFISQSGDDYRGYSY